MTQHGAQDYKCPNCGHVMLDVRAAWAPVHEEKATYKGEERKLPVFCPMCVQAPPAYAPYNQVAMDWIPRRATNDLLTGGTGLEIDLDGTVHRFSSTHEMRQFERESQRRAAGGEGQAFSFRALSQNRGNMDRNTLDGSSFEKDRQIPHDQIGKTSHGRHIGRGVMSREQAERAARGR